MSLVTRASSKLLAEKGTRNKVVVHSYFKNSKMEEDLMDIL